MTEGNKTSRLRAIPSGETQQALAARVYHKYIQGDSLTDQEIRFGSSFYRELADRLIQCGPVFKLASSEANRVAIALEDFKTNRGI